MLADLIVKNIKENFEVYHLSSNLRDTIKITKTEEGYQVAIPAETYDLYKYLKEKVIIYDGYGSYAQQVDEEGGIIFKKHTGHHKNYVEIEISKSINEWLKLIGAEATTNITES